MSVRPADEAVTPDQIERAEWAALRFAEQPQLPMNTRDADWRGRAACGAFDSELFVAHSPDNPRVAEATSICQTLCPAIKQCRALRYEMKAAGVWGGVYYPEKGVTPKTCKIEGCGECVQSSRNPYCDPKHEHEAKIGTRPGYAMHRRLGEDPCIECRVGERAGKQKYSPVGATERGVRNIPLTAVGRTAGGSRRAIRKAIMRANRDH